MQTLALTNGDVQDDWPPAEFSSLLDMVAAGGLAQTITGMATDKDYFRSTDGLGGSYQHPDSFTDPV